MSHNYGLLTVLEDDTGVPWISHDWCLITVVEDAELHVSSEKAQGTVCTTDHTVEEDWRFFLRFVVDREERNQYVKTDDDWMNKRRRRFRGDQLFKESHAFCTAV